MGLISFADIRLLSVKQSGNIREIEATKAFYCSISIEPRKKLGLISTS